MSDNSANNKRIAKNTLMLYIRMFLMMAITLYTSRVILESLGVEDFGIYNVVGGVVVSFSVLTNALSGATTRFITFGLGKGDYEKLKDIFSTSVNIQIYLSIIIIVLAQTVGLWFLNTQMNIPSDRVEAANYIYEYSIITFIVRLILVPFNALIIAHEKMSFYAYISIIEAIMQLGIVYLLVFTPNDKLEAYGFLTMLVAVLVFIMYFIYCRVKFYECRYSFRFNKSTFKDMAGFAGWNFIGSASGILRNNGVDILVNIFFGVTFNAARGIAMQVNNAITKFTQGFMTAIRPQITISYAQNDIKRFHFLINQGTRISYYLMLLIALPVILEMKTILGIWLKDVPENAVLFTQLIIIDATVIGISQTIMTGVQATGNVKKYQIIVGLLNLLNLPVCLVAFYLGGAAYLTYIIGICIELCCLFARLLLCKRLIGLNIELFLKSVIYNIFQVTFVSIIFPVLLVNVLEPSYFRLIITVFLTALCSMLVIYILGLNDVERVFIKNKILNKLKLAKK